MRGRTTLSGKWWMNRFLGRSRRRSGGMQFAEREQEIKVNVLSSKVSPVTHIIYQFSREKLQMIIIMWLRNLLLLLHLYMAPWTEAKCTTTLKGNHHYRTTGNKFQIPGNYRCCSSSASQPARAQSSGRASYLFPGTSSVDLSFAQHAEILLYYCAFCAIGERER